MIVLLSSLISFPEKDGQVDYCLALFLTIQNSLGFPFKFHKNPSLVKNACRGMPFSHFSKHSRCYTIRRKTTSSSLGLLEPIVMIFGTTGWAGSILWWLPWRCPLPEWRPILKGTHFLWAKATCCICCWLGHSEEKGGG